MLVKLATRNIRRSVRDYAIYFVTLLLAVMVFYAFNSITDQNIMREIAESDAAQITEFLPMMMGLFSIVVSLVLGFLVIYSNQLLIRRRKHEFGMYFTLGMTPSQVSRIILYETFMVGIVSLAIGLILGVFLAQLLSFATAALFGIALPSYTFEFSPRACVMTLICFASIYIVVAIFNVASIRRHKLIDLLKAETRNQKVAIRNPWVCLALFAVSLCMLGVAYWQLKLNGMQFIADEHFIWATALMFAGSLLFFFSLSGFLVAVLTKSKGLYLKKLRPFTTRQIASKVNSSFASMWVVSILLFFAITTFSTGMAFVELFVGNIDEANPYDASICTNSTVDGFATKSGEPTHQSTNDISKTLERLEKEVSGWDELVQDAAQVDSYRLPNSSYGEIMDTLGIDNDLSESSRDQEQIVVGESQFNKMRQLIGRDPIAIGDDEYLVTNNFAAFNDIAQAMVSKGYQIQTSAGSLKPFSKVDPFQYWDNSVLTTALMFVVPDAVINDLIQNGEYPENSFTNIQFVKGSNAEDVLIERIMDTGIPGVTNLITRQEMIAQSNGLRLMVTYLALYIGLVLLVATAAVLAIQLLSLTIDSLGRYRMLSKIGCDASMLNRSLFAQVLVYFLLPLILAVCHSGWTINVMSGTLFKAFGSNLTPSILIAAVLVLIVYGGYMLMTYLAGRSLVKNAPANRVIGSARATVLRR